VIRQLIDRGNSLIAWTKKTRRVRLNGGVVKVNVGCSLSVTEGWINVDGSPHVLFAGWPRPVLRLLYEVSDARNWCGEPETYLRRLKSHDFVHHNLEYGLPFSDDSVDFVYSSHVLEHFYLYAAEHMLRDTYRVLKNGGRLRVCVPDLQHAYALYGQGHKEKALSYFFEPRSGELNRHRYMYDFDLLAALLEKAGFRSIERCAYQQGLVPDLDRLDNRPEETLYVECVK
jgi:SAM-dependent methyltransferase